MFLITSKEIPISSAKFHLFYIYLVFFHFSGRNFENEIIIFQELFRNFIQKAVIDFSYILVSICLFKLLMYKRIAITHYSVIHKLFITFVILFIMTRVRKSKYQYDNMVCNIRVKNSEFFSKFRSGFRFYVEICGCVQAFMDFLYTSNVF